MSYPSIIIDSGGGERIIVYNDGTVVNSSAKKLNFSTDFDVVENGDFIDVSLAGAGPSTVEADEIKVYEGGSQVGTVARKLNFDSSDFNVTEDGGNNQFTVDVNFPDTSSFVQQLDREVNQTVASSSGENTIFTHTVPANILATTRGLKFEMAFDLLMNSGTPTLTINVKFGGTTIWAGVTNNFGASATRMPGWFEFMMANLSANNSQGGSGYIYVNNESTTGVSSGIGSIDDDEATTGVGSFAGTASEDTTASKDFVVTVQMSVNNANVQFRKFIATLTLL